MENVSAFIALALYLFSILLYLALVLIFVKPYYRDRIILTEDSSTNGTRALSTRNAILLDTLMYENYYCYGFIYPLFIIIKIIKALWFLIVCDNYESKLSTKKDIDYKLHHW